MTAERAAYPEVQDRVDEVYRLLLTGSSRQAILRYARAKQWGLKDGTIDTYIAKAKTAIRREHPDKIEEIRSMSLLRLGDLYSKAYNRQDYKTCLAIQKHLDDLHGLASPIAISIDQKITLKAEELTDDQLASIISAGRG